jgi:SAM-dependent methyltransferase
MTGRPRWRCAACSGRRMRATADRLTCDACHAPHTRAGGIWTSDVQPRASRFDSAAAERLAAMEQGDHFWLQHRTPLFCRLVDRIAPGRGQIVELGCGGGRMLPAWEARFDTVVAVDASRDLLARARRLGRTATLIQADVCDTPLDREQFDLAAAFDVIEHVDPDALLAEARRLVRPGGHLLLSAPAFAALWSTMDQRAGHRCRYTLRLLRRELDRNGWRCDGHTYYQCLLFPLVYVSRRIGSGSPGLERRPGRLLNRTFGLVNRLEIAVSSRIAVPFGSSLVAWATRR